MYWMDIANQVLIFSIMAMSLNLLLGYMGHVSVAHGAFAAIGGYSAAYLSLEMGYSVGISMLVGVLLAATSGMLMSIPALVLSGEYMILLTLSVQTVTVVLISSVPALGGVFGLTGLEAPRVLGNELLLPSDWLIPLVVATVLVFVVLSWIAGSPFGLVLRGIREDQLATQSLGKDVFARKIVVFGLTSGIAAFGGQLLGMYNGTVSPPLYGFSTSVLLVTIVVLGGRGNMLGSILGAAVVIGAQPFFEKVVNLEPSQASLVRLACFGLLLLIVLMLRPQGLVPERVTVGSLIRRRPASGTLAEPSGSSRESQLTEAAPNTATEGTPVPQAVVVVRDVHKSFGGIKAVDGLSFDLAQGRVTGLIGPNGAGKTTVFNLITGAIPPDSGSVSLFGQDITGWSIDRVARYGMVRSFQDVRTFPALSVLENVRMAVPGQRGETLRDLFFAPWSVVKDARRTRAAALKALDIVGLTDSSDLIVSKLSFGEQKLVALARILASDAKILLLDEPAAGIGSEWADRMVEIISRLRGHGLTVCIVEHNLHVLERVSDHIYFLEAGKVSAAGTMKNLVADERLVEAYFGKE